MSELQTQIDDILSECSLLLGLKDLLDLVTTDDEARTVDSCMQSLIRIEMYLYSVHRDLNRYSPESSWTAAADLILKKVNRAKQAETLRDSASEIKKIIERIIPSLKKELEAVKNTITEEK